MRSVNTDFNIGSSDAALAQLAGEFAAKGMDTYSDYGVGAIAVVNYHSEELHDEGTKEHHTHIYGGFNINISGMEYKVHAEQLALFQAALDIEFSGLHEEATLEKVIVATNENDMALVCGHCLQTVRGFCGHYDWEPSEVEYTAVGYTGSEGKVENYHIGDWQLDRYTVAELLPDTYVNTKE